jgi:hypothetical protein
MNKPILYLKPLLSTTALSTLALVLAGCATTGAAPTYVDASTLSPEEYANAMYIARVERYALMRGIDVQWVNAPELKQATTVVATTDDEK